MLHKTGSGGQVWVRVPALGSNLGWPAAHHHNNADQVKTEKRQDVKLSSKHGASEGTK